MDELLNGIRYNFIISSEPIHKETKRKSFVTNVNALLSLFNVDGEDPRFWENEWILKNKEIKKLIFPAKKYLSDKNFLFYLEDYLDLDRKESEWGGYE